MRTIEMNPCTPARDEFDAIAARGFNQIPVILRMPREGLTPLQILRAVDGPDRVLLESTRQSEQDGRYSFIVTSSFDRLTSKGDTYVRNGITSRGNPMPVLRAMMSRWKGYRPEGTPLFLGGAIGYFAYECNHYFERLPAHANDDLGIPDLYVLVTNQVIIVDHVTDEVLLVASDSDYDTCLRRLTELSSIVERARGSAYPAVPEGDTSKLASFGSNFERSDYEGAVRQVQEYIRSGDVYQVNLSQRLDVPFRGEGVALYETLSRLSPVHFASYLNLADFDIVSASPERLVRMENGKLLTRPIAGTRRRGTPEEDARFVEELRGEEKEVSEHAMLVDLERNDLGRVCEYGSVKVSKLMEIVKYAHVIHIESEVEGRLGEGKDFVDVIGAVFPGGTITGMPKVRTMEIITELEPTTRGIYTGSIGYVNFCGDMDFNIVIRTIAVKDGKAYVNVGGGVVWDGVPEREYKETLNKARSQLAALARYEGDGTSARSAAWSTPEVAA